MTVPFFFLPHIDRKGGQCLVGTVPLTTNVQPHTTFNGNVPATETWGFLRHYPGVL